MNYMLFEVWQDADGGGQMAGVVHPQNDKVRLALSPDAKLVQTFHAYSDRDFWRQLYRWEERGEWEPNLDLLEHFFRKQRSRSRIDISAHEALANQ